VAGVSLALFALAAPARAEMAFAPERARLACAGAAPEMLKGRGNALYLPAPGGARTQGCRIEIDFSVSEPGLATRAAASAIVELVGLKRVRAVFPERLAVNRRDIALAAGPDGGLTLSIALETLFGADRQRGVALILAWRSGEGAEAKSYLSPTLIIERTEAPALLRAKRTGN